MKKIKLLISTLLIFAIMFCMSGCGEGEFKPTQVVVVENINGLQYEYPINDKSAVNKLWNSVPDIQLEFEEGEEPNGRQGSSCFYFVFNEKSNKRKAYFTIYDTGSCCIGKDFETFYELPDGVQLYLDIEEICTPYRKNAQLIN